MVQQGAEGGHGGHRVRHPFQDSSPVGVQGGIGLGLGEVADVEQGFGHSPGTTSTARRCFFRIRRLRLNRTPDN